MGKSAISTLNSILWDKKITKENKSLIFKAIVRSIATYGSEIWQLKYQTISKLLTMEMDFWRRSAHSLLFSKSIKGAARLKSPSDGQIAINSIICLFNIHAAEGLGI